MKQQILNTIANDKYYYNLCMQYSQQKDIGNDLYQFVFLCLAEIDEQRLIDISKHNIKGYITRMIWFNWSSKTAPFWRIYDSKYDELTVDVKDEEEESISEEVFELIQEVLEKEINRKGKTGQYHWNVELFNLYVEHQNLHEVSRLTGVPYPTVRYNVNNLIEAINEHINRHTKRAEWIKLP